MHTPILGRKHFCAALAIIAGVFVLGATQAAAQSADYRWLDGDLTESTHVDGPGTASSTAGHRFGQRLTGEDSLGIPGETQRMEAQRTRYLAHFMGLDDPSQGMPLLYASPKAFEWPFERGLDDVRSAEALVRNWTRYRDDDVLVEMDPLSTSVRIVLPLNRAIKAYDR